MNKCLFFILSLLILFSCNTKQVNNAIEKASIQDTLVPPKVTILADLPDSLRPKTIAFDSMPKPLTIVVPNKTGSFYSIANAKGEVHKINLEPPVNKLLPVLQDAKGEPIKDSLGNTFIMGSGGLSNFTSFTTDNGLALDGI